MASQVRIHCFPCLARCSSNLLPLEKYSLQFQLHEQNCTISPWVFIQNSFHGTLPIKEIFSMPPSIQIWNIIPEHLSTWATVLLMISVAMIWVLFKSTVMGWPSCWWSAGYGLTFSSSSYSSSLPSGRSKGSLSPSGNSTVASKRALCSRFWTYWESYSITTFPSSYLVKPRASARGGILNLSLDTKFGVARLVRSEKNLISKSR